MDSHFHRLLTRVRWRLRIYFAPLHRVLLAAVIYPFLVISGSPHPYQLFLRLLRPYPRYFALPAPISPTSAISNPSVVLQRMDDAGLPDARYIWPFYIRDTPLHCLYRMYEWAAIGRSLQVGYETQYFWDQVSWRVEDIPDPKDPDPVRYAVLAGFAEIMAICFNERIDLGLLRLGNDGSCNPRSQELRRTLSREEFITYTVRHHEKAPSWTADVRGPVEPFVFQTNVGCGEIFTKRNVEICGGGNMDWI